MNPYALEIKIQREHNDLRFEMMVSLKDTYMLTDKC